MALLLPSVAMTCKGIRGVANASSSFFAPVFIKGVPADAKIRGRSTGVRARIGGDGDIDLYGETIADDFYSVLGLTSDATADEIKRAYYSCMKSCHPDLSGNHPESTDFCMFVNEIYEVLSDPEQRMVYDEINGYALTSTNPFLNHAHQRDHVFVDEFTCIGCKNCANTAPDTFAIEEDFGRAHVVSQSGNPAQAQSAIETCPVDCIHRVTAAQLTLLEDEMRRIERVNVCPLFLTLPVRNSLNILVACSNILAWDPDTSWNSRTVRMLLAYFSMSLMQDPRFSLATAFKVGMMLSGMGYRSPNVFSQERARVQMMKERGSSQKAPWWQAIWSNPGGDGDPMPEDLGTRERAAKTAAAARRWREYSRQGVDHRGIRNLPSKSKAEDEKGSKKTTALK